MSLVTSVVIVGWLSNDEERRVCEFEWEGRTASFAKIDDRLSGGSKIPPGDVRWGGFNYFSWDKFTEYLTALKLSDADLVVVAYHESGYSDVWRNTPTSEKEQ